MILPPQLQLFSAPDTLVHSWWGAVGSGLIRAAISPSDTSSTVNNVGTALAIKKCTDTREACIYGGKYNSIDRRVLSILIHVAQDSTKPPDGRLLEVYPPDDAGDKTTVEYAMFRKLLRLR